MIILEEQRYARQLALPEIGKDGQKKLREASALVIGAGGLGATLLYCLAGAGLGRIGIADGDTVSLSNLNRQFLHTPSDIGRLKVCSAAEKLMAFRPDLSLDLFDHDISEENALQTVTGYDVVVLAVDSMASRLVLNHACCIRGIPLVDGGIDGHFGRALVVEPGKTACLCCIYGDKVAPVSSPPAAFAPVVSLISSIEAQLALTLLLGQKNPIPNHLLYYDARDLTLQKLQLRKNPDCPVCRDI